MSIDVDDKSASIYEIKWAKKKKIEEKPEFKLILNEKMKKKFAQLDSDAIDHMDVFNKENLRDNILYYMSGFIVRTIFKKNKCTSCAEMLVAKEATEHTYSHSPWSHLLDVKNNGGLVRASTDVLKAIRNAEKLFLIETKVDCALISDGSTVISSIVKEAVLKSIMHDRLFSSKVMCINEGFGAQERSHRLDLVTKIVKKYLKIRLFAYTEKLQNDIICNNVNKRQKLHKLILHLHV